MDMKGARNMVNTLGEQTKSNIYICSKCKKERSKDHALNETWYYSIKGYNASDEEGASEMVLYPAENAEYLCNEHFLELSKEEASRFVQLGYPYSSKFFGNNDMLTF